MGGVSVDSGKGGKKSVDSEVNMIPMIDLLMCLICFLLITAVWSTMARLNADAQVPGPPDPNQQDDPDKKPPPSLHITIIADTDGKVEKFKLSWRAGGEVKGAAEEITAKPAITGTGKGEIVRYPELSEKIKAQWGQQGSHRAPSDKEKDRAILHSNNKVKFQEIVAVIDALYDTKRPFESAKNKELPAFDITFSMTAD